MLSFHALVKENDPTRITKADAQKYRDYLLDSVAASTAKQAPFCVACSPLHLRKAGSPRTPSLASQADQGQDKGQGGGGPGTC